MTSSNEHGVTGDTTSTSPRDRVDRDYLASALDAVDWDGVGIPTADVHVWNLADQIITWATEKTGATISQQETVPVVKDSLNTDLRDRIAAALKTHPWEYDGHTSEWAAHNSHTYYGGCAVCRGDVEAMAAAVMGVVAARGGQVQPRTAENQRSRDELQLVYDALSGSTSGLSRAHAELAGLRADLAAATRYEWKTPTGRIVVSSQWTECDVNLSTHWALEVIPHGRERSLRAVYQDRDEALARARDLASEHARETK